MRFFPSMTKKAVPKAQNLRIFTRVQPEPNAPLHVDINGEGFIDVLNAMDISEGGMRIQVLHRFEGCHIEKPVILIIQLPQPVNNFIQVEGRIKHILNDSFGVQFCNLNQRSRSLVRKYVAYRLKGHSFWLFLRYKLGLID